MYMCSFSKRKLLCEYLVQYWTCCRTIHKSLCYSVSLHNYSSMTSTVPLIQFPVVLQQVYTLVLLQEDNYNILATKKLVQYSKFFSYIFYNKLSSVHFTPRWRQLIIRAASLMPNWRRWKNSWRDSHYNVLNSCQKQETTN